MKRMKLIVPLLLIVLLMIGAAGCGKAEDSSRSDIRQVRLACTELCMKSGDSPFITKTYEVPVAIELFDRAIREAEPMMGVLDYGAYFYMFVSYTDGTSKQYVLNIEDEDGTLGLLVDSADSEQGYTIAEALSSELRRLIYGK